MTVVMTSPATVQPARPRVLSDPGGEALVDIGRLTAHVFAVERVVLPAAVAELADGDDCIAELRRKGRPLTAALHRLDRHLTGDVHSAAVPTRRLRDAVGALADDYLTCERTLLTRLGDTMGAERAAALTRAYHAALAAAPTRPHPHLPTRGPVGRLARALVGRVDRFRDTLDNRAVSDRIRVSVNQALRALDAPESGRGVALAIDAPHLRALRAAESRYVG